MSIYEAQLTLWALCGDILALKLRQARHFPPFCVLNVKTDSFVNKFHVLNLHFGFIAIFYRIYWKHIQVNVFWPSPQLFCTEHCYTHNSRRFTELAKLSFDRNVILLLDKYLENKGKKKHLVWYVLSSMYLEGSHALLAPLAKAFARWPLQQKRKSDLEWKFN